MKKKLVLAYSGGLDTSVILKWLINKNYEVTCFLADVGQKEDLHEAKKKATLLGAHQVYIEDLRQEFVENYIFPSLKANAIYEGKYLLGTSLARPLIAKKQIEIAQIEKAHCVGHGATGKGNDQVRFEMTYLSLMPEVEIVAPWKDPEFLASFRGRTDLIHYAQQQGIPITSTLEKPYSMDENLMHISYEGGLLEDPSVAPPENMFLRTVSPKNAPDKETEICIEFKQGIPIAVEDLTNHRKVSDSAVKVYQFLDQLCSQNGIGRMDLVENRFVGMKSRGVYETPAMTALLKAHLDLEGLVLDREVFHLKQTLAPKIAQLIYNGFWFSPEMDFLMEAINKSQKNVNGKVYMTLYKGNAFVTKRESPNSLYNQEIVSMDQLGNYNQIDAKGFININALRLKRR